MADPFSKESTLTEERQEQKLQRPRMVRVTLSEAADRSDDIGEDVIALNDALETLEKIDPRKGRIVEFRFFAGLTVEETAAVLDVSPQTVARDWTFAKAWLRRELKHR